ncbi:MAG: DUF4286 family protein [Bacteroidota bacterium]|nr:DUF4286 family protein [Ferruginibacter sp.]
MIIYNITTKVHPAIHEEWVTWVKEEQVPFILQTGCFITATVARLLEVDESDGPTYAVQFRGESKSLYNQYVENYSPEVSKIAFKKWGDQIISFRSVMQVVH